ncbi:MAG: GGDEF domain-containing protein, partial [Calditrichaceae bacterium]|nr:GGDEF domain-containing protein [Calditrichaceae bacterium]
ITKPINVEEFLQKIDEYLAGKRDTIAIEDEKKYLQEYNIQLVAKLKKKITELETLNNDLSGLNKALADSSDQLIHYNDHLFFLNDLANRYRLQRDPDNLINMLPQEVIRGFPVKRFIFLELDKDKKRFLPLSHAGFGKKEIERLNIPYTPGLINYLRREGGLVRINDVNNVANPTVRIFSDKLKSDSFLLGDLYSLGTQHDSTQIILKINANDSDIKIRPSRRLLFYMDKYPGPQVFQTYDLRILKSLMQTVSIIHENMVLYDRLITLYKIREQQAIRDELTQVYNYRYFIQEIEREADRTKRFERPFSILMIDLDFFKQFNDEYGHLEGNQVLKLISQIFVENTRVTDTVARYGGEEFVIILQGLNKEAGAKIGEKLRSIIEKSSFPEIKKKIKKNLTISVGVACYPTDSDKVNQILLMADEAMYRAKQAGKNRVMTA